MRAMGSIRAGAVMCVMLAVAPMAAAQSAPALPNEELRTLYQADQSDRKGDNIDWSAVAPRDEARRTRVGELAAAGALRHSDDYLHAAMVYQHGGAPEFYRQAQLWALRAVELDPANARARWLACAAEDRWLHNTGKAQVWGTQFQRHGAGPWTMEPFERAARTDAERRAMGVSTLAESEARLAEMNKKQSAP